MKCEIDIEIPHKWMLYVNYEILVDKLFEISKPLE